LAFGIPIGHFEFTWPSRLINLDRILQPADLFNVLWIIGIQEYLSAGPLVLEMPARGVQGAISDSWQNAIPDTEKPGKYLVLAPGQKAPDNVAGYIVRHSPTVNVFLGVRLTDPDPERGKEALSHLQMYPYTQRDNPPKMEILDSGTKAWSGLPPRGMEYGSG
jgi:hypothetical protein